MRTDPSPPETGSSQTVRNERIALPESIPSSAVAYECYDRSRRNSCFDYTEKISRVKLHGRLQSSAATQPQDYPPID